MVEIRKEVSFLEEIYLILKVQFPNLSENGILCIVLSKIAQIATSKRIQYKEIQRIKSPNIYSIAFILSGGGKDRLYDVLDKHMFSFYNEWFDEKANEYVCNKQKENKEYKTSKNEKGVTIQEQNIEIRYPVAEVENGTQEGLFEDAKILEDAKFGSLFVKISELGLYLEYSQYMNMQFLSTLFNGYDGKISSKSIKNGKREKSIKNLPINCLLFSDPTMFQSISLREKFNMLMQTGLGRRAFIVFQPNKTRHIEYDADIAYQKENEFYIQCEKINKKFKEIFEAIPMYGIYEQTQEAYKEALHPYIIKLKELEEKTENNLLAKEIRSRELKAIKVSCLLASLNHPKDLHIYKKDMLQAIELVEKLSKDIKEFINYRQKTDDHYDKLWQFFLDNTGIGFMRTNLIYQQYHHFGLSRDKFKDRFDDYIEAIKEMATDKGYFLDVKTVNHNSGKMYTLLKIEESPLAEDTISLEEML